MSHSAAKRPCPAAANERSLQVLGKSASKRPTFGLPAEAVEGHQLNRWADFVGERSLSEREAESDTHTAGDVPIACSLAHG